MDEVKVTILIGCGGEEVEPTAPATADDRQTLLTSREDGVEPCAALLQ